MEIQEVSIKEPNSIEKEEIDAAKNAPIPPQRQKSLIFRAIKLNSTLSPPHRGEERQDHVPDKNEASPVLVILNIDEENKKISKEAKVEGRLKRLTQKTIELRNRFRNWLNR